MQEIAKHTESKVKSKEDQSLIKKIFNIDPVDWARYPDDKLSFISPTGQKFSYTQDQIDQHLQDQKDRQYAANKSSAKKPDRKTDPKGKSAGAAAK